MTLQQISNPYPGEFLDQKVIALIHNVNVLSDQSNKLAEIIEPAFTKLQALEQQLLANQSSFDMERSHFILQLHGSKIITRDEARQMLGLPAGERRNPAPFTKEDLEALTNERVIEQADCIMDCLEKAIDDGELPVDIGAVE